MNKRIFWKKVKQQGTIFYNSEDHGLLHYAPSTFNKYQFFKIPSESVTVSYTPIGSKRNPKLYRVQFSYKNTLFSYVRKINQPLGNFNDWNFMDQHSSPRADDKEMIVPMTESSKKKTSSLLSKVEKHYGDEHHDESSIDGLSLSETDTKSVKAGATKISKTISKVFQGLKGVFNHGKKASN